jgi:hypothetical protein
MIKPSNAVTAQAGDVWITDPEFAWDVTLGSEEILTLLWPALEVVEALSDAAIRDEP